MAKNVTPLEHEEQVKVIEWLKTENDLAALFKTRGLDPIMFSAIANGHYQPSIKQQNSLKAEGMNSGVPDLLIIVPQNRCKLGKALMLWIEMKRLQGASVSASQHEWITAINTVSGDKGDVGAFICYGHKEAINLLKDFVIKL
jgi:hypothetical protein